MIKLSNRKKLIASIIILSIYLGYRHKYHSDYELLPDTEIAYAKYDDGYIYIGNEDFIQSIEPNEGDILVEDQRDGSDPDMVIYDSCNIHNKDKINTILEVLQDYEKEYPSDWDRSIESMRLEWLMHNLGYYFNYKIDHTTDIDLDNEDEEKYDKKLVNHLLKI